MTGEFNGVAAAGSGLTVGELFRARAAVQHADAAIEYQGRQISYGALGDRVERATAMLSASGLSRGDRVALLSRNGRAAQSIVTWSAHDAKPPEQTLARDFEDALFAVAGAKRNGRASA